MNSIAVKDIVKVEFIPEQPEVNSCMYKIKGQTTTSGFLWWKKHNTVTENVWRAPDISLSPFRLSDTIYCTDKQYSDFYREDLNKGILVRKCIVIEYDIAGVDINSTIFDTLEEGVKYYNEMIKKWNLHKIN